MEFAAPADRKGGWNWQKSEKKKDKQDKEKHRLDRMREKELQKVEKEQQKLEKEKHRLERERQRTIKREVELEKKKEQLEEYGFDLHHLHRDHPSFFTDDDGKYKYVNVGEYKVEGISEEFAKRLQEWEVRKGQKKEHEPCHPNEAQHLQTEDLQAMTRADAVNISPNLSRQSEGNIILPPQFKEGHVPLPIVIKTHHGVPEQIGSIQPLPETVRVDPTYQKANQTTHETQTTPKKTVDEGTSPESTVFTYPTVIEMQESNVHLRQQLRQKESDYRNLQDDLEGLNRALRRMNESYTKEIASYKRQLWASSNWGQVTNQSKFIADAVTELRRRVDQLEEVYQHRDIPTPQQGHIGKLPEANPDPSALTGVNPALVEYLTKLFAQIQDLRQGIIERNQIIDDVKKHLTMQEVTNLLLNAEIQRREIELQLFKKRHRHGTRRHCTFGGRDFCMREECHDQHSSPKLHRSPRSTTAASIREKLKNLQHGHFDPAAAPERDMPDILRNCGICSEPATTEKREDVHRSAAESPRSSRSSSASKPESPRPPTGRRGGVRIPVKGAESKEITISVKCGSPRRKLARQHERSSFDSSQIRTENGHPKMTSSRSVPSPDLNLSRSPKAADSEPKQKYHAVPGQSVTPESARRSTQTVIDIGARAYTGPHVLKKSDIRDTGQKTGVQPAGALHRYERSATSPLYQTEGGDDDSSDTRTRCSSVSSGSDISGDRSFKIRSATYFSPKPYGKTSSIEDSDSSPRQRERRKTDFRYPPTPPVAGSTSTRQIGPLRKLRSATEIGLSDRQRQDAVHTSSEQHEVHTGSGKDSEGVSEEVEKVARSFRIESTTDEKEPSSQVRKMIEKLSSFDELDSKPESSGSLSVPPLIDMTNGEQPCSRGKVKRLSEVFLSEGSATSSPERTFPTTDSTKTSPAAVRKRSQDEIPKPGTVQKRLQEFSPGGLSGDNQGTWLDHVKWSRSVPKEGTVQKRLDEIRTVRSHSDSRNSSRMSSVNREVEADDNMRSTSRERRTYDISEQSETSPKLSKDVKPEQILSDYSSTVHKPSSSRESEAQAVATKHEPSQTFPIKVTSTAPKAPTQSSLFLRTPKTQKAAEKRLSPLNMLVRDTLTLNLVDTEGEEPKSPKPREGTEGVERRREKRSWFSKGFFKSSKS